MLQINNIGMATTDKENLELKTIIIDYIHEWKYFLGAFIVALLLSICYLVFYPRTYEVFSLVQIQEERDLTGGGINLGEASGLMRSFGLGGGGSMSINIDDEYMIFTSNELFAKMVYKLGINVEYSRPYSLYKMYKESPVKITADSLVMHSLYNEISIGLNIRSANHIDVVAESIQGKKKMTLTSLPAVISLSEGDFILEAAITPLVSQKLDILIKPVSWKAEELVNGFLLEEVSKSSNILELTCRDHIRERGIDKIRVLVDFYNARASELKNRDATKIMNFLDDRIDFVFGELAQIEKTIEEYKLRNNVIALEYDIQFYADQIKEFHASIIEYETQYQMINMIDSFVRNPENKYNLIPSMLTMGEGNPIVEYNNVLLERTRYLQNTTPDNPLIIRINEQIDQLRESVYLTIENSRTVVYSTLNDLKRQQQALFDKLGKAPVQERAFYDYNRQREILQGVYLILLQKREEAALSIGVDQPKALVVDAPYVKKKSVAPRKLYAMLFMVVFTLFIPMFILFFKNHLSELIKGYKEKYRC